MGEQLIARIECGGRIHLDVEAEISKGGGLVFTRKEGDYFSGEENSTELFETLRQFKIQFGILSSNALKERESEDYHASIDIKSYRGED